MSGNREIALSDYKIVGDFGVLESCNEVDNSNKPAVCLHYG